jgi:aminopeptidase N
MTNAIRSLTRAEAEERARLLTVDRYDVEVDMTGLLDGPLWRATSTTTFRCSSPGVETFADCVADVVSATLNDRPVPAEHIRDGRIRLVDPAEHNVLVVEATQRETSSQRGVQRCVDPSDQEVYVWTSFEPDDARMCWACFDQPDLKAPHAFTVLAPQAWTVLSNSAVASVSEEDGARRWVFEDTPALSPYVTVVNGGPFHEVRDARGGYDLGLFCRRSLATVMERDAEEMLALTEAGLAFFGERFGQPFAQRKYDQVFIPEMAGAMENWGCVTWGDFALFRNRPTRRERSMRAEFLLHEMAHMWFGDLVTMRWWDDLWLNEAFATWASLWAMTEATEYAGAWATFLSSDKITGYVADRAVTRHPIRQPASDVAEATATFDAITYVKGASVLKQLVAFVGEDAFVDGLRSYFADHAWDNTTLADLMGAIGKAAGRDLESWTTDWLDRAGTDRVELARGGSGTGWTLTVTAPDGQAPRPHRLDIGVYTGSDSGLRRTALVPVETSGERTTLPADDAGQLHGADLLLVNDEDLTFAVVAPDASSREVLLERAGELPTPMARAVAMTTAWNLLDDGAVSAEWFVRCAVAALRSETEAGVAQDILARARAAATLWSRPADRDRLVRAVADVGAELVADADLRDSALRTLAATASTDAHIAAVREAAAEDLELAWTLLVRLASQDRLDEPEIERLLARDPDPDAWIRALKVRTAVPSGEAKEAAWRAVFVDRTVGPDRAYEIGSAFWQPGQEELLRPYTTRFLDAVSAWTGGNLAVLAITRSFFPTAVGDEELVTEVERVASAEGFNPTVRLNLLEKADTLARMVRARRG